jgi:hypothetical protein
MKRTIEKEKELLDEFDEDVRVSDLTLMHDDDNNLFAVGPDGDKALQLEASERGIVFEETVLNVKEAKEVDNTDALEETEYHLEKEHESEEDESSIIVVEPVTRGDDHAFF